MPLPSKPLSLVVPVIIASDGEQNRGHDVVGTAFIVAPKLFMSAKHVFGITPPPGQSLAVVAVDRDNPTAYAATVVYLDPKYDIAIAWSKEWPGDEEYLQVAPTDLLAMNEDVLTIEYSQSERNVPLKGGEVGLRLASNWHKGHIIRQYDTEFGHDYPVTCIDLSYPAFKRASGAPVIQESSGWVLGMVVANVERHLMPAHLERVERPDGVIEEIRYFLPSAQAIAARYLRNALISCLQRGPGSTTTSSGG